MKANKQISNLRHFLNSLPDEEIAEKIIYHSLYYRVKANKIIVLNDFRDLLTLRKFKYNLDIVYNEIEIGEEFHTKQEQINIIYKSYEKKLLDLREGIEKLYIKYPKARGKGFDSIYCSNEYIKTADERELYYILRRDKDYLINDLNTFIILFEYDIYNDGLLDDDIQENLIKFINKEMWLSRLCFTIREFKARGLQEESEITENFIFSILDIYNNIQTIPPEDYFNF
jgi:hypothetical protein